MSESARLATVPRLLRTRTWFFFALASVPASGVAFGPLAMMAVLAATGLVAVVWQSSDRVTTVYQTAVLCNGSGS